MRLLSRGLLITALIACGLPCAASEVVKPGPADRGLQDLADANNRFGVGLYQALTSEDDDGSNLFLSPYSMYNALLMVAEGARGDTEQEVGAALQLPAAVRTDPQGEKSRSWNLLPVHTAMAELQQRLQQSGAASAALQTRITKLRQQHEAARLAFTKGTDLQARMRAEDRLSAVRAELNRLLEQVNPYEIQTANAVWVERTYPLNKPYLDVVGRFYKTNGAREIDFQGSPEAARQRINEWVGQHTGNRINDLLPPDSVTPLTRMVVTNAVYFKGEWLEPFEKEDTKPREFRLADGGPSKALIMQGWSMGSARYAAFNGDGSFFSTPEETARGDTKSTYPADDGFAMLELPYKGGHLSMVVIAPLEATRFSELETSLTADHLQDWLAQLRERRVHVLLPKFKLETEYQMRETLGRLGMSHIFSREADLSGLAARRSGSEPLYLSEVLHKTFLELDERGTEAVAATASEVPETEAPFEPEMVPFVPTFHADRPFIFLIREREGGTVLFLGRVMRPMTG